jgi:hypothetical protein
MSCTLASVRDDIAIEKASTKPKTNHAIDSRFIGRRKSRSTGIRRIATARDAAIPLIRIPSRALA